MGKERAAGAALAAALAQEGQTERRKRTFELSFPGHLAFRTE